MELVWITYILCTALVCTICTSTLTCQDPSAPGMRCRDGQWIASSVRSLGSDDLSLESNVGSGPTALTRGISQVATYVTYWDIASNRDLWRRIQPPQEPFHRARTLCTFQGLKLRFTSAVPGKMGYEDGDKVSSASDPAAMFRAWL